MKYSEKYFNQNYSIKHKKLLINIKYYNHLILILYNVFIYQKSNIIR